MSITSKGLDYLSDQKHQPYDQLTDQILEDKTTQRSVYSPTKSQKKFNLQTAVKTIYTNRLNETASDGFNSINNTPRSE